MKLPTATRKDIETGERAGSVYTSCRGYDVILTANRRVVNKAKCRYSVTEGDLATKAVREWINNGRIL